MARYQARPLRALLLDLDDTLLDNRTGMRLAWEELSRWLGARVPGLDAQDVLRQLRESTRWFWSDPERAARGRVNLPEARRRILLHVLEQLGHPAPEAAAEGAHVYTRLREQSLTPIPGAFEALAALRERVPALALVTNGAAEVQRAKIERFGLAPHFDVIAVEGELGRGKPDPAVYAHVLDGVGAKPGEALMVGDDYHADVLGALGAGLEAAWIDPEARPAPPAEPPRPHATLRSVVELLDLIEP